MGQGLCGGRTIYAAKGDLEAALGQLPLRLVLIGRLLKEYEVIDEIPFDSERKRMSVLTTDSAGKRWLFSKGPRSLVAPCSHYRWYDRTPPDASGTAAGARRRWRNGDAALRVLAVATVA